MTAGAPSSGRRRPRRRPYSRCAPARRVFAWRRSAGPVNSGGRLSTHLAPVAFDPVHDELKLPIDAVMGLSRLRALVLAGSRAGERDAIAQVAGVSCKALAPVNGHPMIERPVSVLLESERIAAIDTALPPHANVAAEAPRLAEWLADRPVRRRDAAASPARTVHAALGGLAEGEWLLVTTADHALLDAAMLEQFLDRCDAPDIDAFAALLPLEILEAAYPDMRRTGIRLRDGRYSGCNLFLLRNGEAARNLVSFWVRLETLRKSPLRMALAAGPAVVLGYGLRLLTLSRALASISRRTGARLAPSILDIPEAAIDVDTLRDLAFVEKLLAEAGDPAKATPPQAGRRPERP